MERTARGSERRYEIVQTEADHVRTIVSSVLAGDDLGAIARELNKTGATTRAGAPWRSPTVRRIALSPFYAALLPPMRDGRAAHYKAEDVDLDACTAGDWEPIVTEDELRAVRAVLLDPARQTNGGFVARKWLLSGHARCGAISGEASIEPGVRQICGLVVRSARSREGYHAYRCPRGHFLRRGDILNDYVSEAIVRRLSEPDASALIRPALPLDLSGLRARETTLRARVDTYLDLVDSGTFSVSDIKARKERDDSELAEIRKQLSDAVRTDPLAELLDVGDVRATWSALSLHRKQAIIEALVIVVILPVGKGKRITTMEGAEESVRMAWRHNRADSVNSDGQIEWTHPLSPESAQEVSALLA